MIIENSPLSLPEDPEQPIWRYYDFTKFVDFLQSRELYFSRSDLLGDPFEGSIPVKSVRSRLTRMNELVDKGELLPQYRDAQGEHDKGKRVRENMFVSCWHMGNHESAAMWKLYLKSNEGIAIRSRVSLLKRVLAGDPNQIALGKVNYIDYKNDYISWSNVLTPFVHKRLSFEHEREFRALMWRYDGFNEAGVRVKVIVEDLVDGIYVCPDAPSWFMRLVETVTQRLGFGIPVYQSDLGDSQVFY